MSQAESTTPQREAAAPPYLSTSAASSPSTDARASEGRTFILKPPSMDATRGRTSSSAQVRVTTGRYMPFSTL